VLDRAQMLELFDLPATFPLLWDIMGWNIQLYISPLSIKRPEPRPAAGPLPPAAGYHQDSGRPRLEMQWDHAKAGETQDEREMVGTGTTPMLALKIAYFLTDTTVPDCGAMRVIPGTPGIGPSPSMPSARSGASHIFHWCAVPGTHQCDAAPLKPGDGEEYAGSVEGSRRPAPAGTAVLFDRRLWHSASRNFSDVTRKVRAVTVLNSPAIDRPSRLSIAAPPNRSKPALLLPGIR
jgi:ectoine hydroxylase